MDTNFHVAILNDFHLSTAHAEKLKSYYVLHWQVEHLLKVIHKNRSFVEHNGVLYVPIFRINVHECHPTTQLRLSFRETKEEDNLPNIVLVKKLVGTYD